MKMLFKSSVIIPEACSAFGELSLNSTHFEILFWSNNLVLNFFARGRLIGLSNSRLCEKHWRNRNVTLRCEQLQNLCSHQSVLEIQMCTVFYKDSLPLYRVFCHICHHLFQLSSHSALRNMNESGHLLCGFISPINLVSAFCFARVVLFCSFLLWSVYVFIFALNKGEFC